MSRHRSCKIYVQLWQVVGETVSWNMTVGQHSDHFTGLNVAFSCRRVRSPQFPAELLFCVLARPSGIPDNRRRSFELPKPSTADPEIITYYCTAATWDAKFCKLPPPTKKRMTTVRCSNFVHTFYTAAIFARFAGVKMSAPTSPRKMHSSRFLYLQLHTKSLNFFSQLLCVFAKLRKAAISFFMSICPSVRKEKVDSK